MRAPCESSLTTNISLDAYLDGIKNLPPTPTVLIKLIDLFRQPEADVDDIVQLLRRDPALAAEVLRRCNNSFLDNGPPIEDVNEAVYRLGFYEVYKTTVLLFGLRAIGAKNIAPGFPAEELRRHSSIAAIAAGTLAGEFGASEGVAFTAGLLHDIGKLAMGLAERDKYVQLIHQSKLTGIALSKLEEQTFGFNHSEVGAQLLRRWDVPEEIIIPVLGHTRDVLPGEPQSLTVLTQVASELANHITAERGLVFSSTDAGQRLIQLFELETHQLDSWEHLVRAKLEQVGPLEAS